MDASASEIALVYRALCSGLSNCVEYIDDEITRRIRADADLRGLQPRGIKELLLQHVARHGIGTIKAVPETDEQWRIDRGFNYQVLIEVLELARPLFVKMVLSDDDKECPVVKIVSVHLTSFA